MIHLPIRHRVQITIHRRHHRMAHLQVQATARRAQFIHRRRRISAQHLITIHLHRDIRQTLHIHHLLHHTVPRRRNIKVLRVQFIRQAIHQLLPIRRRHHRTVQHRLYFLLHRRIIRIRAQVTLVVLLHLRSHRQHRVIVLHLQTIRQQHQCTVHRAQTTHRITHRHRHLTHHHHQSTVHHLHLTAQRRLHTLHHNTHRRVHKAIILHLRLHTRHHQDQAIHQHTVQTRQQNTVQLHRFIHQHLLHIPKKTWSQVQRIQARLQVVLKKSTTDIENAMGKFAFHFDVVSKRIHFLISKNFISIHRRE